MAAHDVGHEQTCSIVGQPLSPGRLLEAVAGWLREHQLGGDLWSDGRHLFLGRCDQLRQALLRERGVSVDLLNLVDDLADLSHCYGYEVYPGQSGGVVFLDKTKA